MTRADAGMRLQREQRAKCDLLLADLEYRQEQLLRITTPSARRRVSTKASCRHPLAASMRRSSPAPG
jgi:hypothetical protein